ncbi:MAG: RNA polymerase sigma factor [Phycisphaerae bacterium]
MLPPDSSREAATSVTLLVRIRDARDSAAWDEFDAMYRPLLMRYAMRKGLSSGDADDVVQYCMTLVHRHIQTFEYDPAKGRFKSWLLRIAQNHMLNRWDKHRERGADTAVFDAAADASPAPDDEFDLVWKQAHLRHAFERLRGEVQESTFGAFHEYVIEQKSVEETCARWNMNRNTLDGIKFRLTRKLRDILQDMLGAESDF